MTRARKCPEEKKDGSLHGGGGLLARYVCKTFYGLFSERAGICSCPDLGEAGYTYTSQALHFPEWDEEKADS